MKTGKGKIKFALFVVAAISLGTTLLSLSFMNRMTEEIEQIVFHDVRLTELGESITSNILKARREEKNFIIYLDTLYIKSNRDILHRIKNDIDQAEAFSPVFTAKLDSIETLLAGYDRLLSKLVLTLQENPRTLFSLQQQIIKYEAKLNALTGKQKNADGATPALDTDNNLPLFYASIKLSTEKSRLFAELKTISSDLINSSESITREARSSLISHSREGLQYSVKAQRNTITLLMIAAFLLIFLIFYLPRQIFLPYRKLKRLLEAVSRGNLEVDLEEVETSGELGDLSRSFSLALNDLQKLNRLKTAKIAANKRNLIRIIEEVKEAVIIVSPDFAITQINDSAKKLLGKSESTDRNSLREFPDIWEALEQTIVDIYKSGRSEISIKLHKNFPQVKKGILIPNINRVGQLDSIIIIIK